MTDSQTAAQTLADELDDAGTQQDATVESGKDSGAETDQGKDDGDKGSEKTLTLVDDPGPDDDSKTGTWPEDWRQRIAGEDEKALKRLARYGSPADVGKALLEAQNKLASGKHKQSAEAPPEGASEEELTAWRKENGIPETPDGYMDALPDGLVIGDDDKAILDSFLAQAHATNRSPADVAGVMDWYVGMQEQLAEEQQKADAEFRLGSRDELRDEWGADYKSNINMISGAFVDAPEGLRDSIMGARMPDGSLLGDNVAAVQWLSGLGRQLNPAAALLPSDGQGGIASIDEEIASIEKMMKNNRKAYNADTKIQERYRELVAARDRIREKENS